MVSNQADRQRAKWTTRAHKLYVANYLLQSWILLDAWLEPTAKVSALYLPAITLVASAMFHLMTIYLLRIAFEDQPLTK